MIPGLLHGRLLGAAQPAGVVAAPAYLPLNAYKAGFGSGSASAAATFTINPNGTWASSGTSYANESGNWYLPTTADAGSAYEVRFTLTLLSGSGAVITNQASDWAALSSARQLQAVLNRYTNGTSSVRYSVKVEIRLTGGVIVSTGTFQLGIDVDVSVGGGGSGCPTLDMVLPDGRTAAQVNVGDWLLLVNPETGDEELGEVTLAETKLQPCVELVAANGARFKCSTSAPMATTAGDVKAPDLLGCFARIKTGSAVTWGEVVEVTDIGEQLVRHITVGNRHFWIGGSDGTLWAHHNAKQEL